MSAFRTHNLMRAIVAALLMGTLSGCNSSSASSAIPKIVPPLVPLTSQTPSQEATFAGILTKVKLSASHPTKWQIRNPTQVVGLPVDVSKVAATAKTLAGQRVLVTGKWVTGPNNAVVLSADKIQLWTTQEISQ